LKHSDTFGTLTLKPAGFYNIGGECRGFFDKKNRENTTVRATGFEG
jgi:hypothetical protein